jgi:predicted alpha/beta-fold hydrolase
MNTKNNEFRSNVFLPGGHLQTILPALTRKVKPPIPYIRERISTSDGDFLDLDWMQQDQEKLVILSHGLEGSSDRPYIMGMGRFLFRNGFDILAWNFRGCSGEMNRALRMYHSGATDDLSSVVTYAQNYYKRIFLIGFSLGGNLTLKYLGEQGAEAPVERAVTYSVPLDLHDGVTYLDQGFNRLYALRFLKSLKKKVLAKHYQYPRDIDITSLDEIETVYDFDDTYTSWIHGFHGAPDYYYHCSSIRFVENIKIPTLIVNAANDTMIGKIATSEQPFPNHDTVDFMLTRYGGHCGFGMFEKTYWSEIVALNYLNER